MGFARDYFFVNLNYQMSWVAYQNSQFKLPEILKWLSNFSAWQLYYLKYLFTALSVMLFFLSTLCIVHVFFREKKYLRWVWFSYLIVVCVAGIIFLSLNWVIGFEDTYALVRKIMEFVESPLLTMIVFPAIVLDKNFNPTKKH